MKTFEIYFNNQNENFLGFIKKKLGLSSYEEKYLGKIVKYIKLDGTIIEINKDKTFNIMLHKVGFPIIYNIKLSEIELIPQKSNENLGERVIYKGSLSKYNNERGTIVAINKFDRYNILLDNRKVIINVGHKSIEFINSTNK